MYQREVLGLAEARAALDAALAEASKEPDRPMAIAVVDDRGDLICCVRMDGAAPVYMPMAINKAYTAARLLRDTRSLGELQRNLGRELATWGDSRISTIHGGQCIIKPSEGYIPGSEIKGTVLGGIATSGRFQDEDEKIALAGLKAIKF